MRPTTLSQRNHMRNNQEASTEVLGPSVGSQKLRSGARRHGTFAIALIAAVVSFPLARASESQPRALSPSPLYPAGSDLDYSASPSAGTSGFGHSQANMNRFALLATALFGTPAGHEVREPAVGVPTTGETLLLALVTRSAAIVGLASQTQTRASTFAIEDTTLPANCSTTSFSQGGSTTCSTSGIMQDGPTVGGNASCSAHGMGVGPWGGGVVDNSQQSSCSATGRFAVGLSPTKNCSTMVDTDSDGGSTIGGGCSAGMAGLDEEQPSGDDMQCSVYASAPTGATCSVINSTGAPQEQEVDCSAGMMGEGSASCSVMPGGSGFSDTDLCSVKSDGVATATCSAFNQAGGGLYNPEAPPSIVCSIMLDSIEDLDNNEAKCSVMGNLRAPASGTDTAWGQCSTWTPASTPSEFTEPANAMCSVLVLGVDGGWQLEVPNPSEHCSAFDLSGDPIGGGLVDGVCKLPDAP